MKEILSALLSSATPVYLIAATQDEDGLAISHFPQGERYLLISKSDFDKAKALTSEKGLFSLERPPFLGQ